MRGRSSGLKGADASPRRPAYRPALDPGDLGGPWGSKCGQARACPGDRRGTPITAYSQDQESQNYMIEVSTVSGDGLSNLDTRPSSSPCNPDAAAPRPNPTPAQTPSPSQPTSDHAGPAPCRPVIRIVGALCAALGPQLRPHQSRQADAAHNPALLIRGIMFS